MIPTRCLRVLFSFGATLATAVAQSMLPQNTYSTGAPAPGVSLPFEARDREGYVFPNHKFRYVVTLAPTAGVQARLSKVVEEELLPGKNYNPKRGDFSYPTQVALTFGFTVTVRDSVPTFAFEKPAPDFPAVNGDNIYTIAKRLDLANMALYNRSAEDQWAAMERTPDELVALPSKSRDIGAFAMAALENLNPDPVGKVRAFLWLGRINSSDALREVAVKCRNKLRVEMDEENRELISTLEEKPIRQWALEEYKDVVPVWAGVRPPFSGRAERGGADR